MAFIAAARPFCVERTRAPALPPAAASGLPPAAAPPPGAAAVAAGGTTAACPLSAGGRSSTLERSGPAPPVSPRICSAAKCSLLCSGGSVAPLRRQSKRAAPTRRRRGQVGALLEPGRSDDTRGNARDNPSERPRDAVARAHAVTARPAPTALCASRGVLLPGVLAAGERSDNQRHQLLRVCLGLGDARQEGSDARQEEEESSGRAPMEDWI
eukprot:scaffold9142_cov65-Phaeocystis_antarctica.AAC.7